jgi:hypothetical protein
MDSKRRGGYREGLVLSPPAGFCADTSSLCLFSAFPPGASLFSRHEDGLGRTRQPYRMGPALRFIAAVGHPYGSAG